MTEAVTFTVDELAQEIRRVDGNHSLGAGQLAEALMPFISRRCVSLTPVVWQFKSSGGQWVACHDEEDAWIWENEGREIRALYTAGAAS